jgi:hypothetical protein
MEIKLCPDCRGKGRTETRDREGYHTRKCNRCNETGRVVVKTYEVELPIDRDLTQFYISDRRIMEAIQEIKLR